MRPLQLDPALSASLINEGFARSVRVLAGSLRRAGLAEALGCAAPADAVTASVTLGERIWAATARSFLSSPLREYALQGHLDNSVGYAHILPVLAEQGISLRDPELREGLALLSNEICSLLGRLLVVAAMGGDQVFSDALERAKWTYLRSFQVPPPSGGSEDLSPGVSPDRPTSP